MSKSDLKFHKKRPTSVYVKGNAILCHIDPPARGANKNTMDKPFEFLRQTSHNFHHAQYADYRMF